MAPAPTPPTRAPTMARRTRGGRGGQDTETPPLTTAARANTGMKLET